MIVHSFDFIYPSKSTFFHLQFLFHERYVCVLQFFDLCTFLIKLVFFCLFAIISHFCLALYILCHFLASFAVSLSRNMEMLGPFLSSLGMSYFAVVTGASLKVFDFVFLSC